jgi:hypothetical protein
MTWGVYTNENGTLKTLYNSNFDPIKKYLYLLKYLLKSIKMLNFSLIKVFWRGDRVNLTLKYDFSARNC